MPTHTFLWHDYETFGANVRRDRPAQFAAIRTDAELNEIGDPLMVYCQPAPDFLPDPQSCLITGITPQECLEKGIPEHALRRRSHGNHVVQAHHQIGDQDGADSGHQAAIGLRFAFAFFIATEQLKTDPQQQASAQYLQERQL